MANWCNTVFIITDMAEGVPVFIFLISDNPVVGEGGDTSFNVQVSKYTAG
jgi:hypothetical protein